MRVVYAAIFFVLIVFSAEQSSAQFIAPAPKVDSPYLSKAWRDSVNNYAFRKEAYHQEYYSYDWAMLFACFPVLGENFVNQPMKGIEFSAVRLGLVGAATVGTVRLIKGSSNTPLNIGLLAGGIVGYVLVKWLEITDVMHTVSHLDEDLVEKFQIATPDIIPGSIRYPRKEWPDWVTTPPPAREPVRAREAIDKPLPNPMESQPLRMDLSFPF